MMYPDVRLRRLRQSEKMRNLVAETRLHPDEFILPIFFDEARYPSVPAFMPMIGFPDMRLAAITVPSPPMAMAKSASSGLNTRAQACFSMSLSALSMRVTASARLG